MNNNLKSIFLKTQNKERIFNDLLFVPYTIYVQTKKKVAH